MSGSGPSRVPPYQKPWLSYADQVETLVTRGLKVSDAVAAERFLSHVNYYRFSGYCLAFEQQRHQFNGGCTFEAVRAAYEFDLVLRDIVTEALEVLEVDFRAAIAHHFGERHGAFGHVDSAKFHFSAHHHADWIGRLREETQRSSEQFVSHFRRKYSQFPDLPIWMAMEVMSFGALSKMFKGMVRDDQRAVASRYGIQFSDLDTIFHHLVYVRNLCAHHSRIWDRVWSIKPSLPSGKAWRPPYTPSNERVFATILLLYHLMDRCVSARHFSAEWRDRVKKHLSVLPPTPNPLDLMGMPANWVDHPVWK